MSVVVLNCSITRRSLWVLLIIGILSAKASVISPSVADNSTNDSFNFHRSSWVAVPNKEDNADPTKGKIARIEQLVSALFYIKYAIELNMLTISAYSL